jgi:hypothetical protein
MRCDRVRRAHACSSSMDEDEVSFPKRAVEAIVELTSTPV